MATLVMLLGLQIKGPSTRKSPEHFLGRLELSLSFQSERNQSVWGHERRMTELMAQQGGAEWRIATVTTDSLAKSRMESVP